MNIKTKRLVLIVAAVVFGIAAFASVEYTSQVGFCNSCHEMNEAFTGWETGVHGSEHCYGCHTDDGIIAKAKVKANGLREVYIHLTQEVDMATVQSEVPENRCLKCHDFNNEESKVTPAKQRISAFHLQHKEYKYDCLSCHSTVGHTGKTFVGFRNESCQQCHQAQKAKV